MSACSVCRSPHRPELDAELVRGAKSLRLLASETGLSPWALHRHRQHIPAQLVHAEQVAQVTQAGTLLSRIEKVIARCERISDAAELKKDWPPAVAAIRELIKALELLGRVKGELDAARVQVNVQQNIVNVDAGGDPDVEIARLISQVTNGFAEEELVRYKALAAENSRTIPAQSLLSDSV